MLNLLFFATCLVFTSRIVTPSVRCHLHNFRKIPFFSAQSLGFWLRPPLPTSAPLPSQVIVKYMSTKVNAMLVRSAPAEAVGRQAGEPRGGEAGEWLRLA